MTLEVNVPVAVIEDALALLTMPRNSPGWESACKVTKDGLRRVLYETLWAVYVEGPDDVIAAPDLEAARRLAAHLNFLGGCARREPREAIVGCGGTAQCIPKPLS